MSVFICILFRSNYCRRINKPYKNYLSSRGSAPALSKVEVKRSPYLVKKILKGDCFVAKPPRNDNLLLAILARAWTNGRTFQTCAEGWKRMLLCVPTWRRGHRALALSACRSGARCRRCIATAKSPCFSLPFFRRQHHRIVKAAGNARRSSRNSISYGRENTL
jgi:hypothetical protein